MSTDRCVAQFPVDWTSRFYLFSNPHAGLDQSVSTCLLVGGDISQEIISTRNCLSIFKFLLIFVILNFTAHIVTMLECKSNTCIDCV